MWINMEHSEACSGEVLENVIPDIFHNLFSVIVFDSAPIFQEQQMFA